MTAADWLPVVVTAAIQIIAIAYVYGRLSQRVEDHHRRTDALEAWKHEDAEPMLNDHETRIALVESKSHRP